MAKPGDIFYSKTLGTYVVFEPSEGCTCEDRLDWYSPKNPSEVLLDSQVGELEPVVRQAHYEAAFSVAKSLASAISAAQEFVERLGMQDGPVDANTGAYINGCVDTLAHISGTLKHGQP